MKIIPKSKEEVLKEKETLRKNLIKAGLDHVANEIYADYSVHPTQYYRFGSVRSVKSIKEAIKERNEGNKQSFAVQMHDFEDIIPHEILSVMVNRRVEAILKRRVKEEMSAIGLSTSIPENVYDPDRDKPEFGFDESLYRYDKMYDSSFFDFTEDDDNGY